MTARDHTVLIRRLAVATLVLTAVFAAPLARAQRVPPSPFPKTPDSVTIAAGKRYTASPLHSWFAGGVYRDLWAMPIRVPVLDLTTFAGGIRPTKAGGGMQTKSLRFKTVTGEEYVFRLTDKAATGSVGQFKNTITDRVFQDQVSAMQPAGAQIAAPIMEAAGVLHPTGVFMVLADDSLLGKFRKEFAGRLGLMEEFPNVPDEGPGFAGASKIIDSEELLKLLNTDATQHVDARAYLAARLVDFVINDNDRHEGNWKWARIEPGSKSEWVPIARDRDHAFVWYSGMLASIARLMAPSLVSFGNTLDVAGLTLSGAIDERLLSELDKTTWDSVARAVQAHITDASIAAAVRAMPVEYQASSSKLESVLKLRRAALSDAADEFYHTLAARVLVHGTDSADHATIDRVSDDIVDVRLESKGKLSYSRRFDAVETSEILVYLHDGNDTAVVTGRVQHSILVRVIGGNGTNVLIDSSQVRDDQHPTRLYDAGTVRGVSYGADTLFDRRPWEMEHGVWMPPHADHGTATAPLAGLTVNTVMGVVPRVGAVRYEYGFGERPYSTMLALDGEYATRFRGGRATLIADKRLEASPVHFTAFAKISDLDYISFHGFGNTTLDAANRPTAFYDVHEKQWSFFPAVALAIGPQLDISLGPAIQHSVTDSARSGSLAANRPYGFGTFNTASIKTAAAYTWRAPTTDTTHVQRTIIADVSAQYFPSVMTARSSFEEAAATVGGSIELPVPLRPLVVARAGGKKLYGDFPFFEAATLGGEGSNRYMDPQRYAGDASLFASSELRIPLAQFQVVLPLRVGILGIAEAGRVYDHGLLFGNSGDWHPRTGEGVWVGMRGMSSVITLVRTTGAGQTRLQLGLGLSDIR